jgi:hypothetical protein
MAPLTRLHASRLALPAAILTLFAVSIGTLGAQNADASERITDASVRAGSIIDTIRWLSSSEYDGRLTGSPGNVAAARDLAARLEQMGYVPPPGRDSLLHWYRQPVIRMDAPPRMTVQRSDGASVDFAPGVDFDVLIREGTRIAGTADAPLTLLTPDISDPEWIADHRDDVLLVSVEDFERLARDQEVMRALFHPTRSPAAIVLELPQQIDAIPRGVFLTADTYASVGPMLLQVSHAAGRRLRDSEVRRVRISSTYRVEIARVPNVAARLPASPRGGDHNRGARGERSGPAVRPPLLLTAHLDGPGRLAADRHYPGAIDNASGVAVVMELARALVEQEPSVQRPVWVVLFNGEEQGLRGSRAFVDAFRAMIEASDDGDSDGAVVINVDMVGHSRELPVLVTGAEHSETLAEHVAATLREHDVEARVERGGGSDHASFTGEAGPSGAAAVTLVQAPYLAMHTPHDAVDNATPELLAALTRGIRDAVSGLRDRAEAVH